MGTGAFYIAIEEDALLLNKTLKLKCTCFKNNVCKVGVPKNSIEKYLEKIRKIDYSYVVYNYNSEKNNLEIYRAFIGKHENKTRRKNINCALCGIKGISNKKHDKYLEAVKKLYGNG